MTGRSKKIFFLIVFVAALTLIGSVCAFMLTSFWVSIPLTIISLGCFGTLACFFLRAPSIPSVPLLNPPQEIYWNNHIRIIEARFWQSVLDHLPQASSKSPLVERIRTTNLIHCIEAVVSLPQERLSFFLCQAFIEEKNGRYRAVQDFPEYAIPSVKEALIFQQLRFISTAQGEFPNSAFILDVRDITNPEFASSLLTFLEAVRFPLHNLLLKVTSSNTSPFISYQKKGVRIIDVIDPSSYRFNEEEQHDHTDMVWLFVSTILKEKDPKVRAFLRKNLQDISLIGKPMIASGVDNLRELNETMPFTVDYAIGPALGSLTHLSPAQKSEN